MLHVDPASDLSRNVRRAFGGTSMVNSADLKAVNRPAIAGPDLVARWGQGADAHEVNRDPVQGSVKGGYTDYPFLHG